MLTHFRGSRRIRNARAVWTAFAAELSASVSVELGIALSTLLLIYVHLVDFSRAFEEKERVVKLSGTLSNLLAQQPTSKTLSAATLDEIFDASSAVMTPFPATNLKTTLSVVDVVPRPDLSCCEARVRWTVTRSGTLRPCAQPLLQVSNRTDPAPDNVMAAMVANVPLSLASPAQLVIADVRDQYRPMFGVLNALFSSGFGKTTYAIPRAAGVIALENPARLAAPDQVHFCN